jgi:CMP-N,N'-diacetyllegionaminic acid synthase
MKDVIHDLLILIPARSGSKGIKNKNIVPLSGKPLLYWTAKVAINSSLTNHIVLSTDSEEISEYGKEFGLTVPFLRPQLLSGDSSLQIDVIKHAIKNLEENEGLKFGSLMLLQPTSPFRSVETLRKSYEYFISESADTLITVSDISKHDQSTVYSVKKSISDDLFLLNNHPAGEKNLRGTLRQNFPQIWWRNGLIYLFKIDTLLKTDSMYGGKTVGMVTNLLESVNIDSYEDLELSMALSDKVFVRYADD